MIQAAICTIGDEILIGQIVDTNSSHIARMLNSIGVKVARMCSVSDDNSDIKSSIDALLKEFDIVIVTGGLGPTKDDITKKALGELFGSRGYYHHEGQWEIVKKVLTSRGIELFDTNYAQADIPEGAEVIVNRLGTAPCMVFRFHETAYRHSPVLYSAPGVPFEALGLLPDIQKDICSHFSLRSIYHKTIVTFGIPESTLAKKIELWEENLPEDIHLAYLPNSITGVRLRLSIYGVDAEEGKRRIDEEFSKVLPILGEAVYGEGEDTLQDVIVRKLIAGGNTLSVAESCTGGRIASLFTQIRGVSKCFMGSVTSYDNSVKRSILGVPEEILETKGAVSSECAEAMATGVLKALDTDYGLATTGIAGPDGGTPEKPAGTVWVAVARKERDGHITVSSQMFRFSSNRSVNIDRFSSSALNMLRINL